MRHREWEEASWEIQLIPHLLLAGSAVISGGEEVEGLIQETTLSRIPQDRIPAA